MSRRFILRKAHFVTCASLASGLAAAGVALATFSAPAPRTTFQGRKSTDAPLPSRGKLGQDLFIAIGRGDISGVEALLAKGADPNARNGLEFMPLYMAAALHQAPMMDDLLKAGAQVDGKSAYGTPLMFACVTANLDGAKVLIEKGADVNVLRSDGMNPLMMATNAGFPPLVAELLTHKVDVKAQDDGGTTALSLAARHGSLAVGDMLVAAGAPVNSADADGQTPLMEAAVNGHADFVKMLLAKGAKPNAKDGMGRTALLVTASYGDYPEVIKALVAGKANPKAKDAKGRTAIALAASRGNMQTVAALGGKVASRPVRAPKEAVNLSLKLIQSSMLEFNRSTTCLSCHQEGLGRIATGSARAHGYKLDAAVQKAQMARIQGMLTGLKPLHEQALKNPEAMKQLPLVEINEVTTVDSWLLAGMAAQNQPPTNATGPMVMCLARQQMPDGSWTFALPRVPMQSSFFTFTALSVKALQTYGPKSYSAEIAERLGRAKNWLLTAKPQNSEDRASRLMGLKWLGASTLDRQHAIADITADQRADGGWSQLPNMHSDAYATGQALYALHLAGVTSQDRVYKRGVQYLLRTQDDDGSWFVTKRAFPANNYFDAGFPHGESQYASFNGTCWATLALLESGGQKASKLAMR